MTDDLPVDCPAASTVFPILVSLSSLAGCFYVIGTYWYVPALRQHPAGIMFGMSVYGAIYQFLYLLSHVSSSIGCSQIGFFVDFFLTGQETYLVIFSIDLLLALKNPFSASRDQMMKYHICGGLWSIVCALISRADANYALFGICWMHSSDEQLDLPVNSQGNNGNLTSGVFFAVYIVVVYCTSLIAILRTWNTFLKGLRDTFKTRQRILRHLKYYVGCYFGYWTLVLAAYAAFSFAPRTGDANGIRCRVWHLLSCLLLSKGMVNALIWTRTSNILKIIEQLRTQGYVDLPPHEDSINWALRLEILTNTTKGICESVDRAERQARTSSSSCSTDDCQVNANAGSGDIYHCDRKESYAQIEEIILENRNDRRVRGPYSEGVVFYDYAPHVFRCLRMEAKITTTSYRNSLQQTTKERVSEGKSGAFFYFTEDRKYVVKTLTHEELKFLLCILPKYFSYMKNNSNTFMTRFLGCHGLTMNGKTVFFVVMHSVFDTALQIHERFDLKGSWVGRLEGRKPSGTLAQCKFCSAEYVVGGSHDQLCDVRRGEGNFRHQYDQVGKDLNWNRHMALPYSTAHAVAMQLIKDSNFLCKINCIDYSLLVGIHHRSFNVSHYSSADSFETPSRASWSTFVDTGGSQHSGGSAGIDVGNKPFHQAIHGGMSVDEVHGPGVYFMGLIDILQQWNFRKRVEHFVRVYILMQDRHGISVINPKQYTERFQQRVIRELVYDGAADFHDPEMQLQLPDPMYESGRTATTMFNSFDGEEEPTPIAERVSLPSAQPVAILPPPARGILPRPTTQRRRAVSATPATSSSEPLAGTLGPRLSNGLVMEPRASYYAQRASLQPTMCSPYLHSTSHLNVRRPLVPISPRVSGVSLGRSESEISSSNSCATIELRTAEPAICSGSSSSGMLTPTNPGAPLQSPHGYSIVSTPTFPGKMATLP